MNRDRLVRLRDALPRTPHIHGKDEYVNTAVLVLLLEVDGALHFVLERRKEGIRQGGELCFPGGLKLDARESLRETALRETEEELAILPSRIEVLGQLDTIVAPMGATVDAFVGVAQVGLSDLRCNPDEVAQVCPIPVSHFEEAPPERYHVELLIRPTTLDRKLNREVVLLPAKELGLPSRYHQPWGGFRYPVLVYRSPFGIVWGITARLIHDVVSRLGGTAA